MRLRGHWQRLVGRAAWAGLTGLAAIVLVGNLGRLHWTAADLEHFRPQYLGAGLLLTLAAPLLRRRRAVFVAIAAAVVCVNCVHLWPYVAAPADSAEGVRDSVSVLLWNTWRRNDDAERVLAAVRDADADIVVLQETTESVRDGLPDLRDTYRSVVAGDEAVLVRAAAQHRVRRVTSGRWGAFHVEVDLGGEVVDLVATHLRAPTSASAFAQRAEQLDAMAGWVRDRTKPTIVIGDLNATPWSHELVDLKRQCALRDSLCGRGIQATWPFHNALVSVLRVPLDHCLHSSGLATLERSVGDPQGSNHRPLFVRLGLMR